MAKTAGPLHSLSASGSIASTLTFQHGPAGQIVRRHHRGNQTPTAARLAQQERYRAAVADWRALDEAGRAAWLADARRFALTPYQAYMRIALRIYTPPAGALWDEGATLWDGGTTVWDSP